MKKVFVTITNEAEEDFLNLHFAAIRKFDKESPVFYLSKNEIKVPKGAINLYGVEIEPNGYKGLCGLLSAFKVIATNNHAELFVVSSATVVLRSSVLSVPIEQENALFVAFAQNYNMQPFGKVYSFHASILDKVVSLIECKLYFDIFNQREPNETFIALSMLASNAGDFALFQQVFADGEAAFGAIFNSLFFGQSDKLRTVNCFVDCANLSFIGLYMQGHLNTKFAIMRAMRHCLHCWK